MFHFNGKRPFMANKKLYDYYHPSSRGASTFSGNCLKREQQSITNEHGDNVGEDDDPMGSLVKEKITDSDTDAGYGV